MRVFLVDDEPKAIEVLKYLLQNFCEDIEIVGTAQNINDAVNQLNTITIDAGFFDISLKEGDSFQILSQIKKINFEVVFVTAFDEFTTRALKYAGLQCLFKPIDLDELNKVIQNLKLQKNKDESSLLMAREMIMSKFQRIPIITQKGNLYVEISDINYIIQYANYSEISISKLGLYQSKHSLIDFQMVIQNKDFVNANPKTLVNLKNIKLEYTTASQLGFSKYDFIELNLNDIKNTISKIS